MSKKTTDNSKTSHLKDLFLLFAVPVGIALLAFSVIYIPRLLANPKYDFVYYSCESYNCKGYYVDSEGHIAIDTNFSNPDSYNSTSVIHYYEANNDSTRRLTPEEAQNYRLNTSSKSPDDYSLSKEETSNGFLFWGSYDSGWYLKNGAKKKKIELSNNNSYYSQNIKFLGWVEK